MPGLLTRLGRRPSSSRGKGRVWEKANAFQRSEAEAAAKIRVKAEAEIVKRNRVKAEARAKDEAEIKEKL